MRSTTRSVLLFFATFCTCWAARPIPVKVVVVTMFERGADMGDDPGEYQFWVERDKLDRVFPFPQGFHDLAMNDERAGRSHWRGNLQSRFQHHGPWA